MISKQIILGEVLGKNYQTFNNEQFQDSFFGYLKVFYLRRDRVASVHPCC